MLQPAVSARAGAESPALADRLESLCGQKVRLCFQCGKCSAGCPMSFAMDLPPARLHRLLLSAGDEEVLRSASIWLCVSCGTCALRCPNGIDTGAVMDALRQVCRRRGIRGDAADVQDFHRSFLDTVRFFGRTYEVGMIGLLKLRTRAFFQDMALGIRMFFKGKLRLLPHRLRDLRQLRDIFGRIDSSPSEEERY